MCLSPPPTNKETKTTSSAIKEHLLFAELEAEEVSAAVTAERFAHLEKQTKQKKAYNIPAIFREYWEWGGAEGEG